MKYQLDFISSHHQFYLADKETPHQTDSINFWTEQSFADNLAVEDGILGIVFQNEEEIVKCELNILSLKTDNFNFTKYDHVVEASIDLKSGILQILDCPNSHIELEVHIDPGEYRVRVYSNNLKSAFEDDPKDFYQIEVWKEHYSPRNVLKKFYL